MMKLKQGTRTRCLPVLAGMLLTFLPLSVPAQNAWHAARGFTQHGGNDSIMVRRGDNRSTKLTFEYTIPEAAVVHMQAAANTGEEHAYVHVGSAPLRYRPGEPVMPVVPVQIVLPEGKVLDKVSLRRGKSVEVDGLYRIEHGGMPMALLKGSKRMTVEPDQRVYGSDENYPREQVEVVGVQSKRGVRIATVNIYPVVYRPLSGKLTGYESLTLSVTTRDDVETNSFIALTPAQHSLFESVENPEELSTYDTARQVSEQGISPLGICNPAESYRYVVITNAAMRDATTDVTLQSLIAHKQARGVTAIIVTTEDIYAGYTGVDNQEKIRNFIIDAYTNWETEYVLLGGDATIIPVRYLYSDGTTIPSDLYYQCLDGTFNGDGDSYWGEPNDGVGGGDVDLMADVAIGRASAENATEMSNFVYKTLAYANESEASPYLRQAMLMGEYLGSQFGSGIYGYACPYMREIQHGSSATGYTTAGFDASPVFAVDSMYDYFSTWTASQLIAKMNSGTVSLYNHLGHANETNVMKLTNTNVDALTNTLPFFAYSQGCYPGDFTTDCIAEHFTTSNRHGAFAVVFNSRYGWGAYNDDAATLDGPSQRFDRQFWDAYFNEFLFTFGDVNADSHEDNIWDIGGTYVRWCMYETNLFGDPQLAIRGQVTGPMVQYVSHAVHDVGNGDGLVNPGEQVDFRVSLANVGSEDAAGVTVRLSTTDSYVSIIDNSATVGEIPCCGAVAPTLDNMTVSVAAGCPTPHTVSFTLTVNDGADGEWTSTFPVTVYTSSQISGIVRAVHDGTPVSGAVVTFSGPLAGSVTTDAEGRYLFGGIDGTYSVGATASGFLAASPVSVTVPPSVTGVNFGLVRPVMSYTPLSLRADLPAGGTATRTLTITNSGDAPLVFTADARDALSTAVPSAEALYDASHFVTLDKGVPDTRIGKPAALGSGGPDLFGYRWIDSDEPGGPSFIWNDISSSGTNLSTVSGCDDCYQSVSLSFPFEFYGTEYTSLYVSSNGYITFGAGSSGYTNYALPSTSMPANLIAGFYDDLYPGSGGTVYFKDYGDRAVVQFTNVVPYSGSGSMTYQMVLSADGTIMFYYNAMSGTLTSATVGIQNSARNDGLTVVYNASYIKNGLAVRIQAAPDWFTVSPASGTVSAGESVELDVEFSGVGMPAGFTTGSVELTHNDPARVSPVSVPCTLYIDGFRRLSASPTSYVFPSLWTGDTGYTTLTLTNSGDEPTQVAAITVTSGVFVPLVTLPFTVPASGTAQVPVAFVPAVPGTYTSTLTITSDAEDYPSIAVALEGSCVSGPSIAVAPGSFSVTVNSGESAVRTMTITNTGGAPLTFEITAADVTSDALHVDKTAMARNTAAAAAARGDIFAAMPALRPGRSVEMAGYATIAAEYRLTIDPLAEKNVLIIRDQVAWGCNSNEPLLTAMGAAVSVATSAQMASIDLGPFAMILFESQQTNSFYTTYLANLPKFEAYLENGGIIEFHCATYTSYRVAGMELPGGARLAAAETLDPVNYVYTPSHPVVQGASATLDGNYASHESFVNLPADAVVITVNSSNTPTTIEYRVGRGLVLATGLTWEYGYAESWTSAVPLLENALAYALSVELTPDWLTVSPTEGTVPAGSSVDVAVTFSSGELIGGVHAGELSIGHNAPGSVNPLDVPCTLTVDGFRRLSASPEAIAFPSIWAGQTETVELTLANAGNEPTVVTGITCSNPVFSVAGSTPVTVPAFGTIVLPVTFAPASVGTFSGALAITGNAEDNPAIAVPLEGTATSAPSARLVPTELTFNLNPDDAPADQTAVLSNSGGAPLAYSVLSVRETSNPLNAIKLTGVYGTPQIHDALIYNSNNYEHEFVPGRVIVGYKKGERSFSDPSLPDRAGVLSVRNLAQARIPKTGSLVAMERRCAVLEIKGKERDDVLDVISMLRADPNVAYVEPDYVQRAIGIPNDPSFSQLYGMHNIGQSGGTADADIDAPEAWDKHTGNGSVLIGIIDTGIDYTHPDLVANIWTNPGEIAGNGIDDDGNGYIDDVHGWDFAYDDNNPTDGHGHGTHCSGTIAGQGDNGIGVAGVMWNAKLVALKFLTDSGSGATTDAIDAVNYAAAMGIKITSNSWGGGAFSQALMDAIATQDLFIAAAGNDGTDNDASPHYPSSYELDNVIAVAATDRYDDIAYFSCYGATSVDLGAPGVDIYSCAPGSSYQTMSGTSMATPHVSGAAGLVWTYNPMLSALQVKSILMEATDPVASLAGKTVTGGRLNVKNALDGAGPSWLSAAPMTPGSLDPGSSLDYIVTVNPEGLAAGTWTGVVTVGTDDPMHPELEIAVTANIGGCRSLTADGPVDFGSHWVGSVGNGEIVLRNTCNGAVTISGFEFSSTAFATGAAAPVTVAPFGSVVLPVTFTPAVSGTYGGTVIIHSNADDHPELTVSLTGAGIEPPSLSVSPASLDVAVTPEGAAVRQLVLSNTGGADLSVNLSTFSTISSVGTVDILAWVPYTDMSGEYVNTVNAINQFTEDCTITNSTTLSAPVLAAELADRDVFLVMEQEGGTIPSGTGTAFAPVLQELLSRGGTVIYLCPGLSGNTTAFLREAGLMDLTYYSASSSGTLTVTDPSNALLENVGLPLSMQNATSMCTVNDATNIVATYSGKMVVGEKLVGHGRVITIGLDFFAYTANWAQLISNAVETARSRVTWLTLGETAGVISGGGSLTVPVQFSAAGLAEGTYTATIAIAHDAPAGDNPFTVPVTLVVTSENGGELFGRITGIGNSASLRMQGSMYTISNMTIGSAVVGRMQGCRYLLLTR